ncbi:MAG: glycosyltransferase family 4 protein [Verrucomicrobia bacterium]|nr:glycosyltransferase family 4 protein [Verrucomicrobiota bacterium]
MRVVFLNRFYWPEEPATAQLLTDLAEHLAARGHHVTVVTSHPGDPLVPREAVHRGVAIVRVGGGRSAAGGLSGKAVDWGSFLAAATWWLLRRLRGTDTAVAMTDPPMLAVGVWLACVVRGARLFHWVQDVYPELAIELTRHRWLAAMRPARNLAWRRATACVTLGSDMAAVLAAHGVLRDRTAIVPNWAPAGLAPASPPAIEALRRAWGLADKFVVAYSGNLGRVHDLAPVLDLARELAADANIAFLFIGGGAQRVRLQADAARHRLRNLHFHPAQPREQLGVSLGVGDAHLVTLLPGCERYVFPSKLYGVTAVGRPVIFIGPPACELAGLVRTHDLGIAHDRDAIGPLAQAIRALARDPARCARHGAAALRFAGESGGVEAAAARWHALLAPEDLSPPPSAR